MNRHLKTYFLPLVVCMALVSLKTFADDKHVTLYYDDPAETNVRLHAPLTQQERMVCILTRLEFTPAEQAVLLGVSKQRATNLRSQINEKIFNDKSSKTLKRNLIATKQTLV